jgi:hypothetical protein
MSAAILFVALFAGSSSGLRTQQESKITPSEISIDPNVDARATPAHFIPESGTVCFEGETEKSVTSSVSMFRAGPLATFSPHAAALNKSCKEAGFPKLISKNDTCWPDKSMWTKEELDVNQVLTELRARNMAEINSFADRRGISSEYAVAWATCQGGCGQGAATGFRWWGADKQYSPMECITAVNSILPTLRKASKVGSFIADSASMCWEGPLDYMKTVLRDTQRTPGPGDMFKNATVQEKTCSELGYDDLRDPRDECWPEASKLTKANTPDSPMLSGFSMLGWVMGPDSYLQKMEVTDVAYGFPNGTSTDLASCNCQKGGANRDRGMLYTVYPWHGGTGNPTGDYTSRYSDEFCEDLLNKYRKEEVKAAKEKKHKKHRK